MKKTILLSVLCFILLTYVSFGADALYRLMHNDHDTLIIGEIKSISSNGIEVDVTKTIVSDKDLNRNKIKRQLKPEKVTIEKIGGYIFNYDKESSAYPTPKAGDYILASLNKEKNGKYKIAWGCFKVSSLDYKSLNIMIQKNASEYEVMDSIAIKSFINSNGENTEFSFNSATNEVFLTKDDKRELIYKSNVKNTTTVTPIKVDVSVTVSPSGIFQNKGPVILVGIGVILIIVFTILLVKSKK